VHKLDNEKTLWRICVSVSDIQVVNIFTYTQRGPYK